MPAISAASRYAYLSELVAYEGIEITISLPIKPSFSKYFLALTKNPAITYSGLKINFSPLHVTSIPIFLLSVIDVLYVMYLFSSSSCYLQSEFKPKNLWKNCSEFLKFFFI